MKLIWCGCKNIESMPFVHIVGKKVKQVCYAKYGISGVEINLHMFDFDN